MARRESSAKGLWLGPQEIASHWSCIDLWSSTWIHSKSRKFRQNFPKFPCPIGSMYAIYGNIYHQYTPFMLTYIPAPWILWVLLEFFHVLPRSSQRILEHPTLNSRHSATGNECLPSQVFFERLCTLRVCPSLDQTRANSSVMCLDKKIPPLGSWKECMN